MTWIGFSSGDILSLVWVEYYTWSGFLSEWCGGEGGNNRFDDKFVLTWSRDTEKILWKNYQNTTHDLLAYYYDQFCSRVEGT